MTNGTRLVEGVPALGSATIDVAHFLDARSPEPYSSQGVFVDAQLHAARLRARVAKARLDAAYRDEQAEPPEAAELLDVEAEIERCAWEVGDALPVTGIRPRFRLTPTEERVMWTLIAYDLCPVARQLVRDVATEVSADPSTDTLRRIVYGDALTARVWRELSEDGALRRFAIIERTDGGRADVPEHRQTWKICRRILALVHGELSLDPEVSAVAKIDHQPQLRLDSLEVPEDAIHRVEHALDRVGLVIVIVYGRLGHGRRSLLTTIATMRGLAVLRIRGAAIARDHDAARRQLRVIARECRLLELTPLVCDLDALAASGEAPDRLDLIEDEFAGLVLATAGRPTARRWRCPPAMIQLPPLTGAQRMRVWARALPMAAPEDAEILATMYPLAPALIKAAARLAIEHCAGGPMLPEHVEAGLRAVLDDRLTGLATRISVKQSWDDIVLPDDQTAALAELLARIRERRRVYEDWGFAEKLGRGLGVSALFSGPPGTGKTMAAGLVARELHTELYQVDLSKIASKWIGEAEKNLAALFDAAEAGHALLLFDEADALFGKRTSVRSSNDRHANHEINFLLQRLETYSGICILTTNHEAAIDDAFRRRFAVHIRFPMPDIEERKKLWRAMIPDRAPVAEDLPLDDLAAKYAMSGGHIRNAVLRAAFIAAHEQAPIDAEHLIRAAQLEYEALGKVTSNHT